MSNFKKNSLAIALVAGLGLAGVAGAYTYFTDGNTAPEKVSNDSVANSTDVVTMTQDIEVFVDGSDLIVGRTTGFQVRLNLFGGTSGSSSTFFSNPTPTNGPALPAGWNVALAAGGAGANFAVFNVTPPSTPGAVPGIVPGEIFHVSGTQLTGVEELAVEGGIISGQAFFADPVSATEIANSRKGISLLQSGNPAQIACDTSAGDSLKRIDVVDTSDDGGFAAKTHFSPDGSLGGAEGPPDGTTFDFGDITASIDPDFGTFTYQPGDKFHTVLTAAPGTDFSAFEGGNGIFLSTNSNCNADVETVNGVISGNTVTFDYTLADVGGSPNGFTLAACGNVDGTTIIDDSPTVTQSTMFSRTGTSLSYTKSCGLLPLLYNGSVIEVYHINPAGNTTAQSFVRIINRSSTDGKVTIHGIDDMGNPSDSDVTFFLEGGHSMQVNSEDLEGGNAGKGLSGAWGNGAGKWRAIVTTEFAGARVQGLNRNANDGTVTNLTDADGQGEQTFEALFDSGNGGGPL